MTNEVNMRDFRERLQEILKGISEGEEYVLMKYNLPVAKIVRIDTKSD